MITALLSRRFIDRHGAELQAIGEGAVKPVSLVSLPEEKGAALPPDERERINCIFLDQTMRQEPLYAGYLGLVRETPRLQWIQYTTSGVAHQAHVAELAARGVIITNCAGANAEPVAQTALAGLLMLARGFGSHLHSQARREWTPLRGDAVPDDLRGQTLLLIGVGAIGTVLAGYARGLGLKVVGVRRSPPRPGEPVDEIHPPARLPELLPRADWIVIACALTNATRNLLDAAAFGRMKKGARLINIARGEVVDEAAMIEALRSGRLGGAALDAHVQEPLPPDSPLWTLPNVIISPHNAYASTGNEERCAELFVANFGRWIRGETMLNVQDVARPAVKT